VISDMRHTGVFATNEEQAEIEGLAAQGWQPQQPMVAMSIADGIARDEATANVPKRCHQIALTHGLLEIPGYYGLTQDGEFVTV